MDSEEYPYLEYRVFFSVLGLLWDGYSPGMTSQIIKQTMIILKQRDFILTTDVDIEMSTLTNILHQFVFGNLCLI